MRQRTWLILAISFGGLIITNANSLSTQEIQANENGKELYDEYCKACHRPSGKGFLGLFPPLTDAKWVSNDSLVVSIITKGLSGPIEVNGKEYEREMRATPSLSDAEVAAIINYIRVEFAKINTPINKAQVAALRKS